MVSKQSLLVGASFMMFVSAAHAQDVPATNAQGAPAAAPQADKADAPAPGAGVGVGDIVVMARRRSELLQNVPIAVSAISGELAQKAGITNSEAITIATPSLDFSRQISQGATPFLRGVGSTQAAAGGESPVAVYVDDVYIGSPNGNLFGLNNIASVQVLKGPQGTLFGRNATGGVIQVLTKRPSSTPELDGTFSYGSFNTIDGSIYGTTGLTDNLAINFAGSGRRQYDGYGHSTTTGADTQLGWDWNVRSELAWNPGSQTKILLIGDYAEQSYDYGSNSSIVPGRISSSGATYVGAFNTPLAVLDRARIKQGGASLRIDQEMSFADFVSISAYRHTYLNFRTDQDGGLPLVTQVSAISPTNSLSQEFQLASKEGGKLKWIVGAFYLHTVTGYDPSRVGGLAFGPSAPSFDTVDTQRLNSIAGFGEATYEILHATNLTLGLRYTKDFYSLDMKGQYLVSTGALNPGTSFKTSSSFPKLTYRAILDHKFGADVLGYVSYSRGFRSGGYNLTTPGTAASPSPAIHPEVIDSYEAGLKTKLFGGILTLNGSAYYYDYRNLAVSIVVPTGSITLNAAAAHIKGADFDFILAPFAGFRINGGVGIIDGHYTSFPNGPVFIPKPATCAPMPQELPGARTGGNLQCAQELAGNRTARSPKLTLSVSPSYTFTTGIGDVTLATTYYHNSGFFWDASNRLTQPSYDLVNTSVSFELPSKNLGIRFWVRNLLDDRYYDYAGSAANRDQIAFAAPRTFGATASFKLR